MARLGACLLLVLSTILAISPVSGQGIQHGAVLRFSPPRLELDLLEKHIVLSSRDWLGGRGVDVYYDTSKRWRMALIIAVKSYQRLFHKQALKQIRGFPGLNFRCGRLR
jgi:hypothetical protein